MLQLLSLKEKKLEKRSYVTISLIFFLLGRVAVTWANALELQILLIESKNSFFYETFKNPGDMDFFKICLVICHSKFILCFKICLLVKFYIHEITNFLLIFYSKG